MRQTCSVCGAPLPSEADLIEHMQTAHRDAPPDADLAMNPEAGTPGFVCALCGRRFPTPAALARHNLSPHSPSRTPRRSGPLPG